MFQANGCPTKQGAIKRPAANKDNPRALKRPAAATDNPPAATDAPNQDADGNRASMPDLLDGQSDVVAQSDVEALGLEPADVHLGLILKKFNTVVRGVIDMPGNVCLATDIDDVMQPYLEQLQSQDAVLHGRLIALRNMNMADKQIAVETVVAAVDPCPPLKEWADKSEEDRIASMF